MLDDLKYIHDLDKSDALGFIEKQPEQLKHNFSVQPITGPIRNVVFSGMGGSSLVAELARTWPRLAVPFVISKNYSVPEFVGSDSLVICVSYSGNTEETVSSLADAQKKGAQIVVITHGGKLAEEASAAGNQLVTLPVCQHPRTGILYVYRALVEIFCAAKLIEASAIKELTEVVPHLQKACSDWLPLVPQAKNDAKKLALEMMGRSVVIYGGPLMYPAAYKWKINTNENAKNTAWSNQIPEFDHNELTGWSSHPVDKPFAVINLISSYEHSRVLKRFSVADQLLSGKRPKAIEVAAKGKSLREHLLYLVLLSDFSTTYLAILNGIDPTPVPLVNKFKKGLDI